MGILRQVQGGDEEFRAETAAHHVVKDMFKLKEGVRLAGKFQNTRSSTTVTNF